MVETAANENKEPLLAKLKRKTANAGHATRLGAYKTKKNAQIQALKFKIVERKKQYGVEYMDLIEQNASQSELQECMDRALADLAELRGEVDKHTNKIDLKEEKINNKIVTDAEPSTGTGGEVKPAQEGPREGPRKPSASQPATRKPVPAFRSTGQQPATSNPSSPTKVTKNPSPTKAAGYPASPTKATPSSAPNGFRKGGPTASKPAPAKPFSPQKKTGAGNLVRVPPSSPNKTTRPNNSPNLRGSSIVVDTSKYKLKEGNFMGGASYVTMGKQEVVKGKSIDSGIKLFKANPHLYTAMYYQSDMVDWQPNQHQYTLIHREGTDGYSPKLDPKGFLNLLMFSYERLPPMKDNALPKKHRDAYTDAMVFNGRKLHSKSNKPLLPGRGMGIGDIPELKIIGDVDPSDIHQGRVGDCWLLSGISALAEFDGAVKRLFRKTKDLDKMPRDGPNMYTVTLWDLTTWKEVDIIIDERLCAAPDGQLLASKPSEDGELWVCYIEKAVAAHCGGWDKLVGGQCTHAWSLLTGCKEQYMIQKNPQTGKYVCHAKYNPYEKRWAKHGNSPHEGERGMWKVPWPKVGGGGEAELTQDELFKRLVAWDKVNYIVGAGTKGESDKNSTDGLVDNHAYSVIESHDNVAGTGIGLLKVRNPWGRGEIEDGEFDDDGPGWDRYPQIKRLLNPVVADDGIFWVTKKEFFQYYETIYLSASDMTEFLED